VRKRLDRLDVAAGQHRLGDAAAEPGAGECGEFALPVCRASAKRPEPAPAGESAGRCEIGVRSFVTELCDSLCRDLGSHSLCRQPGADRPERVAAAMQRSRPAGGVGGIIQKPRFLIPSDDRIDLGFDLLS